MGGVLQEVVNYFEIRKREYSSNIVVEVKVFLNEDNKVLEHRSVFLVPCSKKAIGDKIAQELVNHYNKI